MGECIFCRIGTGTAPADVVCEWPDAIAFRPLGPVTNGHTLVIPKEHVENYTEDPEVTALTMQRAAQLAPHRLIWLSQSLWSERQARKAERTVAETPQQREDRLWDAQIDQSLRIAEHEAMAHARLAPVADVVPIRIPSQRRGGDAS